MILGEKMNSDAVLTTGKSYRDILYDLIYTGKIKIDVLKDIDEFMDGIVKQACPSRFFKGRTISESECFADRLIEKCHTMSDCEECWDEKCWDAYCPSDVVVYNRGYCGMSEFDETPVQDIMQEAMLMYASFGLADVPDVSDEEYLRILSDDGGK